jgi:hypothetical protein
MLNLPMQGENVHLTFVSTAAAVAAAPMVLYDANFNPRPLKSYERLIIDDLEGNTSAGIVDILTASTGTTAPAGSTLIASFNTAVGLALDVKEGISLPLGVTPTILPEGTASTANIRVSGNGRIVEGTTQGVRPNWQAPLTPGGNY